MTTIRDVARHAGVGPEVTRRVQLAVAELGFQPSSVARSLKTARTHILACAIPDISNPFFPELVRGAENAGRARGYATLMCNTCDDPDKEADYLRLLDRRRVDGLILIPSLDEAPPPPLLHLMGRGTPVVVVERRLEGFAGDVILVDNQMQLGASTGRVA